MSEPLEMNVDFETSDTEMNLETNMNCNIEVPLPIASATQLGGIKVGENISTAPDGTLSAEASPVVVDDTLTIAGAAADAKKTGDEISGLKEEFTNILDSAYVTDTASGSIANFPDGADNVPVKSLTVNIEPVQDLHGYDHPWAGGGGKNLLNNQNTSTTVNGITFTVNSNGTVTATGTATNTAQFRISFENLSGDFYFTGCPSGGGGSTYDCYAWDMTTNARFPKWNGTEASASDLGKTLQQIQIPSGHSGGINCRVYSGATVNGIVFEPMIVASSETDSTYAPYENICPISGRDSLTVTRTGGNVLDEEWELGFWNSSGEKSSSNRAIRSVNYIPVLSNTVYYCYFASRYTSGLIIRQLDASKQILSNTVLTVSRTFTTLANCRFIVLCSVLNDEITTYNHDISINYPATDTDYHEGHVQTVTIALGSTIYGGTLDVTTGTLTIKSKYKTLSTSNWARLYDDQCIYYTGDNSKAIGTNNLISDMFKTDENRSNNSISGSVVTQGIYVRDDSCTTLEEFKTKYPTINVLFERTTYQTVQLSANDVKTILGQNNIWNDCGDTEVEYRADTKLYIEKLTEPDTDMVADHAISANRFFMVGNTLYRAKTAIASGATITVGTNATKLSLSDALNALA